MNRKSHQSGFALLMLLVVLLSIISVGLSNILPTAVKQKNTQAKLKNQQVLQEAKEALLSYAVDYRNRDLGPGAPDLYRMGRLPCPDLNPANSEGVQDTFCGLTSVNAYGYFPFKTVGKGLLKDASNECLWYIVSGDYKNSPPSELLNWDSVGYLNLVDQIDQLKHGDLEDDFPIAFIISPGASINQNRAPDPLLPACNANFTLTSYLEGGPGINYAPGNDLPLTANTLWEILTTRETASLVDVDYNDQVIAIYKNELWDRVRQLGDLSFDNSDTNPGPAPGNTDLVTSSIESLTKSLAECIAAYGNDGANPNRLVPFAAPLDLNNADEPDQYSANEHYDEDDGLRAGRFPQKLDNMDNAIDDNNLVLDTSVNPSYCESKIPAEVTNYDERFWESWKDHFFYIVSDDFDNDSGTPVDATRCDTGAGGQPCISVSGKANKIAAMVIFAGEKQQGQDRVWWWDDAGNDVDIDDKGANINNYLEGDLATVDNSGAQVFDFTTTPILTDYVYCVEYDNVLFTLSAIKCADL